jgi:hypothetical protein
VRRQARLGALLDWLLVPDVTPLPAPALFGAGR